MRIIDVHQTVMPIASDIANAVIDFSEMTVSVVALVSDVTRDGRRLVGYGFNSNGRYAPTGALDRMLPRLRRADPASLVDPDRGGLDPQAVWATLMRNEKPGGHGERAVAVGVVDMAVWDLVAKAEGRPLYAVLAERRDGGTPARRVPVYAAGGYYYPGKGVEALVAEMRGYLDIGYTRVKIKIGGASLADDRRRIEAVLVLLDAYGGGPGRLAVDANGRFDVDQALVYADALGEYDLAWYEEPVDPLDFAAHEAVAERYAAPLATGENLLSLPDARNLVRHAGLRADRDVLQMDPALSYGLTEYLRLVDMLAEHGWSAARLVPHGGHQLNLHIAAALGLGGVESYPTVFQPFGGFADGEAIVDGHVGLPDVPGIGLEEKARLRPLLERLAAR